MTAFRDERAALGWFLQAQRRSVLAIVDGLSEDDMRQSVVPSGWTPIGLIEHLGHAERFWFQEVVAGMTNPPRGSTQGNARDPHGPFITSRQVNQAITFYREQAAFPTGSSPPPRSAPSPPATSHPT